MIWNRDKTAVTLDAEEFHYLKKWANIARDAARKELLLIEVYREMARRLDAEQAPHTFNPHLPSQIETIQKLGIRVVAKGPIHTDPPESPSE